MKYWLSHLPLEVWVDCYRYPWISREELGRIVDRFSNRKFTEYLQFYLHDWGKRKLGHLSLDQHGLHKYVDCGQYHTFVDLPMVPMPENIKSFKSITISYFDAQTIAFLRQIGPILSEDVNLHLFDISSENGENFRIILTNLLPLLGDIHSLSCDLFTLPMMKQCFDEKLVKLKNLTFFHFDKRMDETTGQTTVNVFMDWLNSPGPKVCEAHIEKDIPFGQQFLLAIREQFLEANLPSIFAVIIRLNLGWQWQFAEFHLNNGIGEELHGVQSGDEHVQITRHQANRNKELQDWINENNGAKSRRGQIVIESPKIGSIDAMEEQQKPSTSKSA